MILITPVIFLLAPVVMSLELKTWLYMHISLI